MVTGIILWFFNTFTFFPFNLIWLFCVLMGIVKFLTLAFQFGTFIQRMFLLESPDILERYGKGSWAVVTGPGSGLGRSYAKSLAKKGFNVVLIGKQKGNVEETAAMCKQANANIETKVIIADFTEKNNLQWYDSLYNQMKDLDVSILVCNAGILRFGLYEEIEHKFLTDLLDVFVYNVTILNKKFLKQMRERKQRSAVINVASCAGMQPLPRLSHYCAVKSYIANFTSAIAQENKDKIDYLALCPGAMSTNIMGPFLRDLAASMDTDKVAEHSYKELVNELKVVSYGTLLCNLYGYPLVLIWQIPVVCDMILYHFLALAKAACDHEINKVNLFRKIRMGEKKD